MRKFSFQYLIICGLFIIILFAGGLVVCADDMYNPCDDPQTSENCCGGVPCEDNNNNDSSDNSSDDSQCPNGCCGIKLNTNFPFIGNCIKTKSGGTNPTNAFPTMLRALTKIIMSVILVVCFILIIWSGILWSANKPKEATKLIKTVAITILLLGFSGVILKLINPNFFS